MSVTAAPKRLYWRLREIEPWTSLLSALTRARLRLTVPLLARWYRASVSVTIAPSARLGRRFRLVITPGTSTTLVVGDKALIGDDVRIILDGGSGHIGPGCDLRRMTTLVIGGRLVLEGRNLLQTGVSVHCAEELVVGERSGIAEYATLVDSSHFFSNPGDWFVDHIHSSPVRIGRDCWIGAKATIARGATIGDHVVVGANSLVTGTVPDGQLAIGVPAEPVREMRPWVRTPDPQARAERPPGRLSSSS